MLSVNPKQGVDVKFAATILAYIKSNYTCSKAELKSVEEKIHDIGKLRSNVINHFDASSFSSTHLIDAERFYSNLVSFSGRYPFGEQSGAGFFGYGKLKMIKIAFTWYDSFRHKKKMYSYDLKFEMASILFNIACLYTKEGKESFQMGTKGLKHACDSYRKAAGIFEYLSTRDECTKFGSNALDLSDTSLTFLAALMLAQAQACFFEKAVAANAVSTLVAKLALGCASLFDNAYKICCRYSWIMKSGDFSWIDHLLFKYYCFQATGYFWFATSKLKENKVAQEIAYLKKAASMIKQCSPHIKKVLTGMKGAHQQLTDAINSRLKVVEHENETIYFYPIPKTVPEVQGTVLVYSIPWKDPVVPPEELHCFEVLISLEMQKTISKFTNTVTQTVTEERKAVQEATSHTKVFLSSLNLPAALEAMEINVGLPDEVWKKIQDVQFKGGVKILTEVHRQVSMARKHSRDQFERIKNDLQKGKQEDDEMKLLYGPHVRRCSTGQITVGIQEKINTIEEFFNSASQTDEKLYSEWKSREDSLNGLASNRSVLEAQIPTISANKKTSESQTLEKLLDSLYLILTKRELLMIRMTTAGDQAETEIKSRLINNQETKKSHSEVCEECMAKMTEIKTTINQLHEEEKKLYEQIRSANEKFLMSRDQSEQLKARQAKIQALNDAVDLFTKLLTHFLEGQKFYNDLSQLKIMPLERDTSGYIMARTVEKQELLNKLNSRGNQSGGDQSLNNPTIFTPTSINHNMDEKPQLHNCQEQSTMTTSPAITKSIPTTATAPPLQSSFTAIQSQQSELSDPPPFGAHFQLPPRQPPQKQPPQSYQESYQQLDQQEAQLRPQGIPEGMPLHQGTQFKSQGVAQEIAIAQPIWATPIQQGMQFQSQAIAQPFQEGTQMNILHSNQQSQQFRAQELAKVQPIQEETKFQPQGIAQPIHQGIKDNTMKYKAHPVPPVPVQKRHEQWSWNTMKYEAQPVSVQKRHEQWSCPACTYLNNDRLAKCSMCGGKKPEPDSFIDRNG